jgi:signal transduction histidine kinase
MTAKRTTHLALFGGFVFACSWLCIVATKHSGVIATVWPVDALALTFILRWSRSRREQLAALACFVPAVAAANLVTGSAPALAVTLPLANAIGLQLSCLFFAKSGQDLDSPRSFAIFIAGPVLLSTIVSGVLAVAPTSLLRPPTDLVSLFASWFTSVGLGAAIILPFALAFARPGYRRTPRQLALLIGSQLNLAAALTVVCSAPNWPPLFLLFPALTFAAVADRELGGVTAMLHSAIFLSLATALGHGPAVIAARVGVNPVPLTQVLLASMAFTVIPVTALLRRLKVYADELEQRRADAVSLGEARTRLMAHVGHEIRSPLAGVTALTQLLKDGRFGELSSAQQQTLTQIATTGAEADALASDLMDAAALQLGHASVKIEKVEAGAAVRAAVEAARLRTAEYGATILFDPAIDDRMVISADPRRLRQILVNLIVNGAKYGGRPPMIQIEVLALAGVVRFEVSDNGPGLSAEKRAALFADFQRLGAETSEIPGNGLGLALSREMAQLQQGLLGVKDGELGGLCFWLELPVWRDQRGRSRAA